MSPLLAEGDMGRWLSDFVFIDRRRNPLAEGETDAVGFTASINIVLARLGPLVYEEA